jgi:hypothetical protein
MAYLDCADERHVLPFDDLQVDAGGRHLGDAGELLKKRFSINFEFQIIRCAQLKGGGGQYFLKKIVREVHYFGFIFY